MTIDFDHYEYSPLVRSRQAELRGFSYLTTATKQQVLPMFVLGKWPKSNDIGDSLRKCAEAAEDRPFIVDTTRLVEHRGDEQDGFTVHDLVDPARNFQKWRNFVEDYSDGSTLVPTVQFSGEANTRQIVQQARLLESSFEQIAFRVNAARTKQLDSTINALAAMDNPEAALIYVDLGYISEGNLPAAEKAAITCINSVRSLESKANIVLSASSFPSSVAPYGARNGVIPILERSLYRRLGGREVVMFGDYSSIHPGIGPSSYGYVPRVDLPTPEAWYYFRQQSDPKSEGYVESARNIVSLDEWDPNLDAWGIEEIQRVAGGDAEKMGSPAKWIAVRVNIHLTQQAMNPPERFIDEYAEEDEEDDEDWAI